MGRVQMFVQTQFNLRIKRSDGVDDWDGWCAQRAELFLDVTLPSMLGQTYEGAFDWLVYFDPVRSPPIERVLAELAPHAHIHAVSFDGREKTSWDLRGRARLGVSVRVRPGTEYVVSTKLDSDDGLHRDYLRVMSGCAAKVSSEEIGSGMALNFTDGVLLVEGQYLAFPYEHSPYMALVEPVGEPLTAMTVVHHRIHRRMPVRQIAHPEPMWLQVVHDRNTCNRMRPGLIPFPHPENLPAMFSLNRA